MSTKIRAKLTADPRVESVEDERGGETGPDTDGIWVYLAAGFCNGEEHKCSTGGCVHVVHEWTWTACAKRMPSVRKCACGDCVKIPDTTAHSATGATT
jgi:hypothetical protein